MKQGLPREWRPAATRPALEARARVLSQIRLFFAGRDVLEVETPLLSRAGTTDLNINSLFIEKPERCYLRTSPEFAMKRLVASIRRDIFELGRVFREGETGRRHNPEFTMLEWYRLGWSYLDLAQEAIELLRFCGEGYFDEWTVEQIDYRKLFLEHIGLDPLEADESDCENLARELGINAGQLELQEWLDLLLSHVIQPAMVGKRITIVHDFPPGQAALARVRPGNPPVAERFEIYLGSTELANGYQELTDPVEQEKRFAVDTRLRRMREMEPVPEDQQMLCALRHGLPDCAGVAMGVDRLLMALLELDDISSVLAFPASRA